MPNPQTPRGESARPSPSTTSPEPGQRDEPEQAIPPAIAQIIAGLDDRLRAIVNLPPPLHDMDTRTNAAERNQLWKAAKLDPLSDSLRQKFEASMQAKNVQPGQLTALLSSLADHPQNEIPGALIENLHHLGRQDPQVVTEVLKLYEARPELAVPNGLIESSLALKDHSTTLAAFKLLASRSEVPISSEKLEEVLAGALQVITEDGLTSLDKFRLRFEPKHDGVEQIDPGDAADGDDGRNRSEQWQKMIEFQRSPLIGQALQVATSVLAVLEHRTTVALPQDLCQKITGAAPSCSGDSRSLPERIQRLPVPESEFLGQAQKTVAARLPESYFGFAEALFEKAPQAAIHLPSTVLGSEKLRAEAPIGKLLDTRARFDSMELDFRARGDADRALATIVTENLLADPKNRLTREQLEPIALPLLNAISDFATSDPGGWARVRGSGRETTDAAVRIFADQIIQERTRFKEANIPIFGKGVALLPICHSGTECDPQQVIGIGNRLGMDVLPAIRGDIDPTRCNVRKQEALLAVGNAAAKAEQPITIYFNTHGGPDHLWLGNGTLGNHTSEQFERSEAINYQELADTLVTSQLPLRQDSQTLDFRHINFVFDSCISGDFSRRFLDALAHRSKEAGVKLEHNPTVVSAAQRGAIAFVSPLDQKSYLQVAIERMAAGVEAIGGSDLLDLDSKLNQLTNSDLGSTSSRTDKQDIAIFSPFREGGRKFGERMLQRLVEQGYKLSDPQVEMLKELRGGVDPEVWRQQIIPPTLEEPAPVERPRPPRAPDNNELSQLVLPPAFASRA